MRQNARAYQAARERGESLFNESAFDRGRACYDGELLGRPFRSVVKTFQVRVWRELCDAWDALPEDDRVAGIEDSARRGPGEFPTFSCGSC